MTELKQSLRMIPYWAYLLMIFVIAVNSVYLYYKEQVPADGLFYDQKNGQWIIVDVDPLGAGYKAGLKPGDIVLTVNTKLLETWLDGYQGKKTGDTGIFKIIRDEDDIQVIVILGSAYCHVIGFFWTLFIIMLLFGISSLYILVRKCHDEPARLFFIYIQIFALISGGGYILFPDPLATIANVAFILSGSLYGAVLIDFHLQFPVHSVILKRFKHTTIIFYLLGLVSAGIVSASYIRFIYQPSHEMESVMLFVNKYLPYWVTISFFVALLVAVSQYITSKNTLVRNQLRLLIIGTLFVCINPVMLTFFRDWVIKNPFLFEISGGVFSLIMICCILIAIFRYHIWDIEIFIRKALLYLGATIIIILSYLFLIWIVDRLIISDNDVVRFIILGISVIIFLVLRDRIQRLIDRLFHRETYDSATVVSDFEAKLAGIYRIDELKEKIFTGMDDIFHFSLFTFHLKKENLVYEPTFVYGSTQPAANTKYEISHELEEKLQKAKVFSPEELNKKPPFIEETNVELVVPLVSDGQPNGFFICGQKKSERIYSRQDIQVLSLLAQRVVSLLHTAGLYQKDLDRQLMLERERARISQDMHDDVGASLTRIAILSELAKNREQTDRETKQWLEQITSTSRGVMEEMSQIIWALNPKNDTLEGLIAYIRRFANEYLEPTNVHCSFELPEILPSLPLSVEVRRNIYLVVREALHNVVKHSGAKRVTISLTLQPSQPHPPAPSPPGEGERYAAFILTIRDNGKGFDPVKLEFPGNGLVNMKKRISDVGGEFKIRSKPGEGTLLEMGIPVK